MILQSLRLSWISDEIGYGLFATKPIKKGTITFVQDGLDIVIPPNQRGEVSTNLLEIIEKYSFEDHSGNQVICWDLGKYMNHSCMPNTLTTGYGFEIALDDITGGQEVTDDYRVFSKKLSFTPSCRHPICLAHSISYSLIHDWDQKIRQALDKLFNVQQPLFELLPPETIEKIEGYRKNPENYISVATQLPGHKHYAKC